MYSMVAFAYISQLIWDHSVSSLPLFLFPHPPPPPPLIISSQVLTEQQFPTYLAIGRHIIATLCIETFLLIELNPFEASTYLTYLTYFERNRTALTRFLHLSLSVMHAWSPLNLNKPVPSTFPFAVFWFPQQYFADQFISPSLVVSYEA